MNEVPVGGMTVIRAVLAHRAHEDAVLELDIAQLERPEEVGHGLVLREEFLQQQNHTVSRCTY